MQNAFDTPIECKGGSLVGPWRSPRQMLSDQTYDGHASIHDDRTAQQLGFRGGTIEGPTHFSQVVPLCHAIWGDAWFARGTVSAHYRNAAYEGERVRAIVDEPGPGSQQAKLRMEKADGTEVLTGTVSCAPCDEPTALEERLAGLKQPNDPVILHDVRIGMKTDRIPVCMGQDTHMGDLYPFTLRQKLARITEPSPLYEWIIPFEMVSVLLNHISREHGFPVRGPAVSLFADQEVAMIDGPLLVGHAYEIEREVVAISASRRTESAWIRTSVFEPGKRKVLATMLLNSATLKQSYAPYDEEHARLYGAPKHA